MQVVLASNEYDEGKRAAADGKPYHANPYSQPDDFAQWFTDWAAGWCAGMREQEAAYREQDQG